jgi:hypothetical protein
MCIITTETLEEERQRWLRITKTNIFARHTRPGHQILAYSLSIASKSVAAMILPLPVITGSGEEALRFIDLSTYATFFNDLNFICEPEYCEPESDMFDIEEASFGSEDETEVILAVHEVGDFEASYVPTMKDFNRLDPRFRLPDEIWKKMPVYSDYGFAVFQLKITLMQDNNETENHVHPMAFEFPTRDDNRLFYPTVHVHDGDFHENAGFYHTFYCQRENARSEFKYQRDLLHGEKPTTAELMGSTESESSEYDFPFGFFGYDWYSRSLKPLSDSIELEKCEGLLDKDKQLHSMSLFGTYPNKDIWLGDSL